MASHFKTTDDNNEGDAVTRRRTPVQGSTQGSAHVRAHHGDDESYRAPKANRHAAGTPHSVSAHYIPVVSAEPGDGEKKKRDARFVETDPYDLSGRRDGDPKKRIGRIVSAVLFILGIALILTAAGMWIYNQWQYHEQDVINEELATFADVSDDGVTAPHAHFLCRSCGKVFDVPAASLLQEGLRLLPEGFCTESVDLYYRGLCHQCANN